MKNKIFPEKENALDSPGFLFWKISNVWQNRINKALSDYDLTHTQFVLLAGIAYLNEREDIVSQIMLALHAGTDPMTTSTVVRTLLRKKYITRKNNKHDTRVKLLTLSKKGHLVILAALEKVETIDLQTFKMPKLERTKWMHTLIKIFKNNCV